MLDHIKGIIINSKYTEECSFIHIYLILAENMSPLAVRWEHTLHGTLVNTRTLRDFMHLFTYQHQPVYPDSAFRANPDSTECKVNKLTMDETPVHWREPSTHNHT